VDSRLGPWKPVGAEQRLDRLESLAELRQLVSRYALAVDTRDLDTLVGLFSPTVRVGRDQIGRAALRSGFAQVLGQMRVTIHTVSNQMVDFDDADRASGIVCCRDQLERPDSGRWDVGQLQYRDRYVRVADEWFFDRRVLCRWDSSMPLPVRRMGWGRRVYRPPSCPTTSRPGTSSGPARRAEPVVRIAGR
jgi:hypothetical protein